VKHQDVAGRNAQRQPVSSPSLIISIYDGRELVGTVELIGRSHVAIDATGYLIGTFATLKAAVTSLGWRPR
jgi:hypothetical protein